MKKIFLVAFISAMLLACGKDEIPIPPPNLPVMHYVDLDDKEVKFRQPQRLDLDGDNVNDFNFGVIHVGDPILKRDRYLFYAGSGFFSFLPIDDVEESIVMSKGDKVGSVPPSEHHWYNGALTILVEKVVPENGQVFWAGQWLHITHQYLAVQVERNGKRYFGWIELSINITHEKVILHRAAISKEQDREVRAGL